MSDCVSIVIRMCCHCLGKLFGVLFSSPEQLNAVVVVLMKVNDRLAPIAIFVKNGEFYH